MIRVENLSKNYGHRLVLQGIQLKVGAGECVGLLGPNGSGKTTLIKILATLIPPSSGEIRLIGKNAQTQREEIRSKIGVLTHSTFLYENLTALENLLFYGKLYQVPRLQEKTIELLGTFGLKNRAKDQVRYFSRGMKQRLALARVFLHEPKIFLLDEPFAGLDKQGIQDLRRMLQEAKRKKCAIFLTTHQTSEVEDVIDRWLKLEQGRSNPS
jgi:heme exporter protein A